MIRIARGDLPAEIQNQLDQLQATVNQNDVAALSWKEFSETETYEALKTKLSELFHSKCAYCESAPATQIEHHWPKSPHVHNANRGSASRMFRWNNMVVACSICNGFGGKASHMRWATDDTATLLNPCDDEPLCYFKVNLEDNPQFAIGWMDPRPTLKPAAYNRAEYTITRLKLNTREDLLRGRARTLDYFLAYSYLVLEKGPDYEAPSGKPIRDTFLKILDAREPFLSPIRQILWYETDYHGLYEKLLSLMPEIGTILSSWALPPLDCSSLNQEAIVAANVVTTPT